MRHKSQWRTRIDNLNMNCQHVFWTLSWHTLNCLLLDWGVVSCSIFLVLYYTSYYIYPYILLSTFPNFASSSSTWNIRPARWGITIHKWIKKPTLKEHLHMHWRRQPIFIADQMFGLPTNPLRMMLEIGNIHTIYVIREDNGDTNQEISENKSGDCGKSTFSSNINADFLENLQEVLHLNLMHHDKAIQAPGVPLPKLRSCAGNVSAHKSLPNPWHPAGAIAPPLLKPKK